MFKICKCKKTTLKTYREKIEWPKREKVKCKKKRKKSDLVKKPKPLKQVKKPKTWEKTKRIQAIIMVNESKAFGLWGLNLKYRLKLKIEKC